MYNKNNRLLLNEDTHDSVIPLNNKHWAEYLYTLTPIEQKSDGMYYKREDKFALNGINSPNGSKCRQLLYLIDKQVKENDKITTLIHATNVNKSPQTIMAAIISNHYGLKCIQVAGGTNYNSISKKELPLFATMFGTLYDLKPNSGFNVHLQKRVNEIANVVENSIIIERDITLDHKLNKNSDEDVLNFHKIGANQTKNIPNHIKDLIMPFGSSNSAISVLLGISNNKPLNLKRIHLIDVGLDKRKYMNERLKILNVNLKNIELIYHKTNVHYDKLFKGVTIDDITFHPRYEAKVILYLRKNHKELINKNSLFWIVGSYPDIKTTANNFNLTIPKAIKLASNEIKCIKN